MRDTWTWTVVYRDGARFEEHAPDGVARGFAEALAGGDAAAVELRPAGSPEYLPLRVQLPEGVRPIFFRRRAGSLYAAEVNHADSITVLGWQKTIRVGEFERNVKSFVWIHPDGTVILTDRDD